MDSFFGVFGTSSNSSASPRHNSTNSLPSTSSASSAPSTSGASNTTPSSSSFFDFPTHSDFTKSSPSVSSSSPSPSLDPTLTTPPTTATILISDGPRQGLTLLPYPTLDVAQEYQAWILTATSLIALLLFCLPCLCGSSNKRVAVRFTNWVYNM